MPAPSRAPCACLGFRVLGLGLIGFIGFRVLGLGFIGLRVLGLGFRVEGGILVCL